MKDFRFISTAALLLAALVGCGEQQTGPATYPVTGTVTLDGKPLEKGLITLRDTEGKVSSAAGEISNGEFSFESQPATMRVEITARREVPGKFDESNPGEKTPLVEQYIPRKYNAASEITKEVTAGENNFTFELTSEK